MLLAPFTVSIDEIGLEMEYYILVVSYLEMRKVRKAIVERRYQSSIAGHSEGIVRQSKDSVQ